MDIADATTNSIEGDFNIKVTAVNAGLNGVCGAVNQSVVNKYAGGVTSKILSAIGLNSTSKNVGSMLADFAIREIVSKEGVKLPAYAVEAVAKSVVQNMAGIKTDEEGSTLSQKDLESAMTVVSEAMLYLHAAKDSKKIKSNATQKEMFSLADEQIRLSMKNNSNFNNWLTKNQSKYEELLNHLLPNELQK